LAFHDSGADQASSRSLRIRRGIRRRSALVAAAVALSVSLVGAVPADAVWPVASRSSWMTRGFTSYHKAMDIAAPYGTNVVPMKNGRTVFAGWKSNCGGWQVWVSHGNGLYSAYYHLARHTSWRGEYVTGGTEVIGKVGTSGCVTGPHLHIEVWRGYPWRSGSYRVNPWNYVASGYYLPYRYR